MICLWVVVALELHQFLRSSCKLKKKESFTNTMIMRRISNSLSNSRNKNKINKQRNKRTSSRRRISPRSKRISKRIRLKSLSLSCQKRSTVPSSILSLPSRHAKSLYQRWRTRRKLRKRRPMLMQFAKSPWQPNNQSM